MRKKHAGVSKKAALPCFLLAVHVLAAGEKRREEAHGPGGSTPAQIPQDVVSCLQAHPWVTGLMAKASSEHPQRHSRARESTWPPHSPNTPRDSIDTGQHRDPAHRDGSKARHDPSPSQCCLAGHVNMSHPMAAGNKA